MRINELLHDAIGERKRRLEDAGVVVVEEMCREDVALGAREGELLSLLGELIDKAARVVRSQPERQVVVRARMASRGPVIEVEYTRGHILEPKTEARVKRAAEDEITDEILKYREALGEWKDRVFISSDQRGRTRYVIEVPSWGSSPS